MIRSIASRALAAGTVAALVAPSVAAGQSWRDVTMSRQLRDGDDEIRVQVEYGAGRLTVRSVDDGVLYRMNLRFDEDAFEPVADLDGDRLHLGVESIRRNMSVRSHQGGQLDLELARGVPMDLDLEFGAVRADIDVGGLSLTDLDLSTGASESTFDVSEPNAERIATASFEVGAADFDARRLGNLNADRIQIDAGVGSLAIALDGEWRRDAELAIDMGLGSLELIVPEGLGIRLRKDSFLTSLDSEGLVKRGDVYESVDYDEAEHRVTIDLDAAFGSVSVEWIR